MIKKIFSRIYNLHSIIILLLVAVGLFLCCFVSNVLINEYTNSCTNLKADEISSYATRISYQIKLTDYLNSTNDTIKDELDVASELYGGRIVVIDSGMNILYDSYGRDVGKISVMSEVISAFNGNNYTDTNIKNKLGEYAYAITDSEKNIIGCILFVYSLEKEAKTYEMLLLYSKNLMYVSIIMLVIVGFFASILIASSLKTMKKSLNEISNGNFNVNVKEKGIYEFKSIAYAINRMLARVKKTEEIQQEFVSNVSHELKTPMASMKVLADSLLMMDSDNVDMYKEFLTDINNEIDRENEIITDLLTLVRMDKKADQLNIALRSMNEIMNVIIKRVTPLAHEHNIEVIYESYREISAEVDDKKLIMAITNICENAVKYNKENGKVRIGLNSDTRYVYINVEDTGVGIPEKSIALVFDRFYRVDKARDRENGGTGLGLSIANEIVRLHKGEIKVHSKENAGTTFTIRIPLSFRSNVNGTGGGSSEK